MRVETGSSLHVSYPPCCFQEFEEGTEYETSCDILSISLTAFSANFDIVFRTESSISFHERHAELELDPVSTRIDRLAMHHGTKNK